MLHKSCCSVSAQRLQTHLWQNVSFHSWIAQAWIYQFIYYFKYVTAVYWWNILYDSKTTTLPPLSYGLSVLGSSTPLVVSVWSWIGVTSCPTVHSHFTIFTGDWWPQRKAMAHWACVCQSQVHSEWVCLTMLILDSCWLLLRKKKANSQIDLNAKCRCLIAPIHGLSVPYKSCLLVAIWRL